MSGFDIAAEVATGLADAGAETGTGAQLVGVLMREPEQPANPWDPPPTGDPETFDVTVIKTKFQIRQIDGEMIKATDDRLLVDATGPEPRLTDKLKVGGNTYSIMNVWPIAPGGVAVLYILQGRI